MKFTNHGRDLSIGKRGLLNGLREGLTGGDKILIIQDSPSVNAMLKLRLESGGFAVETVETGEEGVEKASAGQYELILLDCSLPGINGSKVCRILKGKEDPRNTPILFMPAKDEDK